MAHHDKIPPSPSKKTLPMYVIYKLINKTHRKSC